MDKPKPTNADLLVEQTRRLRRKEDAMERRIRCQSWREIAEALDITPSAAEMLIESELERARKRTPNLAKQVLDLELLRLDRMQSKLWPAIDEGDTHAIDCALRIMDRRAKYLGLDKSVVMYGSALPPVLTWPEDDSDAASTSGADASAQTSGAVQGSNLRETVGEDEVGRD